MENENNISLGGTFILLALLAQKLIATLHSLIVTFSLTRLLYSSNSIVRKGTKQMRNRPMETTQMASFWTVTKS